MVRKYFIVTFGCAQNTADSERIAGLLEEKGMIKSVSLEKADYIVINTCMVRESAENRVYGLIHNLKKRKAEKKELKIVLTGCMVGMALRDTTGKFMKLIKSRLPDVDEFLPIEEIGFDHLALRTDKLHAWVPVSNGCNNFCTFCVVPYTRGREISRPYEEIIKESKQLVEKGFNQITLLGMNVNSYGSDLIMGQKNIQVLRDLDKQYFNTDVLPSDVRKQKKGYKLPDGRVINPVYVRHLNRLRIPTLFPYLLADVCKLPGIKKIDFLSSNPWDFSDELIKTIAENPKISRSMHIAVQSGSDSILKKMNRWYTSKQFISLIEKIKKKIPQIKISTDIIVGFCGETDSDFLETVYLCRTVGFSKAYISIYSDRPLTAAHKAFNNDVPFSVKKRRWQILENLINKK